MQKRRQYYAIISGELLQSKYHKMLGEAIWLLLLILRDCDYKTGKWYGTGWVIARELGRKEDGRTIRNWTRKIRKIEGVQTRKLKDGLFVQVPPWLIPNTVREKTYVIGNKKSGDRKKYNQRPEKSRQQLGNEASGFEKIGNVFERYGKPRNSADRKNIS